MSTPPHDQNIIEMRRARVAQLKLRGMSSREIADALAKGDKDGNNRMVSPRTGRPYDHMVILSDLEALRGEWKAIQGTAMDDHQARQFMEIQEIKKTAWATKNPELALKALDREMKLLGTAKDKEGDTYNIYFSMIDQIINLAKMREEDPMIIFEGIAKRLQRANG